MDKNRTLTDEQQVAFNTVISRHARGETLTVIKGAAGTGKMTLLSELTQRFRNAIVVAPNRYGAKW